MKNNTSTTISFRGPYGFLTSERYPSIFKFPFKKGIYIWTIPFGKNELIHYVGMTSREFKKRMMEHLKGYLSGEYGIDDLKELQKGKNIRVWDGLWRGADIEDFIGQHDILFPKLLSQIKLYKIYVAPLNCEIRLIERIEAAMANYLRKQDGIIGNFQDPEIRYRRRKESEKTVVVKMEYNSKIIGLPKILEV